MGGFDRARFGQSMAGPGMDTRQWVSYGLVEKDSPDARSVRFKDEDGNLFDEGPLVTVTLQPSNITVVCRVSSQAAGNGDADWAPFLQQDEVLVVIPEGDESAGPVIIGRMNNSIDKWPDKVAGQDATKNNFAFRRLTSPFILETASSYMVRSATTKANFTIDTKGNIFLSSADSHVLLLNADVVKLGLAKDAVAITMDPTTKQLGLSANGTILLSAAGSPTVYHLATVEGVANMIANVLMLLGVPPFSLPGGLAGLATPVTSAGLVATALPLAAVNAVTGALVSAGAKLGLTAQAAIPPNPLGLTPGIGTSTILVGG